MVLIDELIYEMWINLKYSMFLEKGIVTQNAGPGHDMRQNSKKLVPKFNKQIMGGIDVMDKSDFALGLGFLHYASTLIPI